MTFNAWWDNYLSELRESNVSGCSRCKSAAKLAWDAAKADRQEEYDGVVAENTTFRALCQKKEATVTQLREHIRVMEDAEGLYKAEIDALKCENVDLSRELENKCKQCGLAISHSVPECEHLGDTVTSSGCETTYILPGWKGKP